jgi:plastocyanin
MRRRRLAVLVPLLALLAATVLAAAPPASAGGGGCHRPATDGRGSTLALEDVCFSPTVLRVEPGSTVTIVNRDPVDHPLARPGGEWGWDGRAGDRITVRLDGAGTYPFFCYAHPGMVGVVVAGDGRGAGSGVIAVADPPADDGGGPPAQAASLDAPAGRDVPSFPVAWMVVVALAALAGAAAGTRVRSRS